MKAARSKFAIAGVDAGTPLGIAAPALIDAKAKPLYELERAAAAGADAEAVHDMRVASRRLREVLRLLEPVLEERRLARAYRSVKRITRALGPVRDADVFIDRMADLSPGLGEGGRRCVAFLIGLRMGRREEALRRLDAELQRIDLAKSRAALRKLAESAAEGPDARRPLGDFARESVARRLDAVRLRQPEATPVEHEAEQHALRIDYKRLRYAVEAFAPCYGDAFDAAHEALTAFQDTLGELHDQHVFLEMLCDPQVVSSAQRAGVGEADISQVVASVEARAAEHHARFIGLVAAHPVSDLERRLLDPLGSVPGEASP